MNFWPRITTLLSAAFSVILFGLHEWLDNQPGWSDVPFLWLSGLALAFLLGTLVQDLYNRDSWFRRLVRWWNHIFEVEYAVFREPIPNTCEIAARIRMRRRVVRGEFALRVFEGNRDGKLLRTFVPTFEKPIDLTVGQTKDIQIAYLPVPHPGWTPEHRCWGQKDSSFDVLGATRNIVELEVRSGLRRQVFRVLVTVPSGLNNEQEIKRVAVEREDDASRFAFA